MTLKFTEEHEWLKVEGDLVVVGITAHASEALGDVVFVELPEIGAEKKAGDEAAVVESVKAASDLYAPVSGTVTKVNSDLESDLSVLSSDPYGKGWMIEVELSSPGELDQLMDAAAYTKFCAAESH